MTELAIPETTQSPAIPAAQQPAVYTPAARSIADWAHEADLAFQLATRLADTSFIPSTMRGKVGDITACLLAGNELGLPPIAALKSMDVIHGTPGLRAHAMRALVQSHGHEIELLESTDTYCRMRGRRQGAENWQESVWTIARAQKAGFVAKNPNYKTQPENMLIARATGEISRLIASDALHGVPYTAEELRDSQPRVTAVQAGAPVTAAEILSRRGPAPQAIEAAAEGTPQVQESTEATAEQPELTNWQRAWMDVGDEALRLGWTQQQAEAEFEKVNNGTVVNDASVEDLVAFVEYLQTISGEGGAS
jgi:hypothetical protein